MVEGYLTQSVSFLPEAAADTSLVPTVLREAHSVVDQVARTVKDLLRILDSLQ